jgi:hypothetical protein
MKYPQREHLGYVFSAVQYPQREHLGYVFVLDDGVPNGAAVEARLQSVLRWMREEDSTRSEVGPCRRVNKFYATSGSLR